MNDADLPPIDGLDVELGRRLRAAAGAEPDLAAARGAITSRVGRAKHRRLVAVSTTSAMSVLMVSGAYALGMRSDSTSRITPAAVATEPTSPETSTVSTITESSTTGSTTAPTASTDPATSSAELGAGAVPHPGQVGETTTGPDGSTSVPSPPSGSVATPATISTTFTSTGGSITVALTNGTMDLTAVDPAEGFSSKVERSDGDRTKVTFRSTAVRSTIDVRLVNGAMVPRIDNRGTGDTGAGDDAPNDGSGDSGDGDSGSGGSGSGGSGGD